MSFSFEDLILKSVREVPGHINLHRNIVLDRDQEKCWRIDSNVREGRRNGAGNVAYAANFHPPFQLGEPLEVATLILLLFTVASLVLVLFDLSGKWGASFTTAFASWS